MFKYKLGQELKDKVSGFVGIAMGRTEYSDGSVQYGLAAGHGIPAPKKQE